MRKLISTFILILSFVGVVTGQDQEASVMSSKNSTSTTLDSNATFTGTTELLRGYNSISITVRSDSSGTYKVLFGKTSPITVANAIKTYSFSYTAGDTNHTKYLAVDAPYFKVVYTSSADTQHVFLLATMLHRASVAPVTSSGALDVIGSMPAIWNVGNNTQTVSTEIDSFTISATRWYNASVFSVNDTIEVALSSSFANPQVLYPYTSTVELDNLSPILFPKIYIRRKGVGTATYNYFIKGF